MSGQREAEGWVGLGGRVVNALPAPFLMLVLMNIIFLGVVFWHQQKADEARDRMLTPILLSCFTDLHKLKQLLPNTVP